MICSLYASTPTRTKDRSRRLRPSRPFLNLSTARNIAVLEQLQIEEALFRTDSTSWCLIIEGSTPSLVMGILAQEAEVIDYERWKQCPLPIIRRYSGGGTVVVDEDTLFLAWILNGQTLMATMHPQAIMRWVYQRISIAMAPLAVVHEADDFVLRCNDGLLYKMVGNAQAISGERFVHHSCFIWNYQPAYMNLLKVPTRQPAYRANREHHHFVMPIQATGLSRETFKMQLIAHLEELFTINLVPYEELKHVLARPHRKSTRVNGG